MGDGCAERAYLVVASCMHVCMYVRYGMESLNRGIAESRNRGIAESRHRIVPFVKRDA